MLPAAVMVLMSVWEQLLSPKRTACQAMLFILLACASGAAVCCWQGWVTNTLLLPFMALAFVLFRRALKPNVSVSQSILLFVVRFRTSLVYVRYGHVYSSFLLPA